MNDAPPVTKTRSRAYDRRESEIKSTAAHLRTVFDLSVAADSPKLIGASHLEKRDLNEGAQIG
jgi:hypothetical protein